MPIDVISIKLINGTAVSTTEQMSTDFSGMVFVDHTYVAYIVCFSIKFPRDNEILNLYVDIAFFVNFDSNLIQFYTGN